jgi:urease accessory protein
MTADDDLALRLTRRLQGATPARPSAVLPLTYEQRSRARLRAHLDDGRAVGVLLPRGGAPLRDGDRLSDGQGEVVQVRAAPEPISTAESADPVLLARAAYHLGNRHVALQIEPGRLRWLQDHVLDAMVRGLGLAVVAEEAPFEPEPGAYGGSRHAADGIGHRHGHRHDHDH